MLAEKYIKQESELDKAKQGNKESLYKLIKDNENLIHKILHKNGISNDNMDYEDYFQEACIYMIKAIYKYDTGKNIKLTTYCYSVLDGWVKHTIKKNKSMIKHSKKSILINKNVKERINEGYSIEEIALEYGISEDIVIESLNFSRGIETLDRTDEDDKVNIFVEDGRAEEDFSSIICSTDLKGILSESEYDIIYKLYKLQYSKVEVAQIYGCTKQSMGRRIDNIHSKLRKYYESTF